MCYVPLPPDLEKKWRMIRPYRVSGRIPEDAPEWVKQAEREVVEYFEEALKEGFLM